MQIKVRELQKEDLTQACVTLGKAFATSPNTIAIYRNNPTTAYKMQTVFLSMLKYLPGKVSVAELDGRVVGAMRIAEWPACQEQNLKMMSSMLGAAGGPGSLVRAMKMRHTWKKHDPKKPHLHLDPLGVTPEVQGRGVGSQMMEFYCNIIDGKGMQAYHETDKPENVLFYQRFGFNVIGEEIINDIKNWYLLRPGKSGKLG